MKLNKSFCRALPLIAALLGCTPNYGDDDVLLPELTVENVSYGNNSDQVFDLYLPEGRTSTKTKVIVLIHGGGWINGDKTNMSVYIDYFRSNHPDHAILNLNYTLAVPGSTAAFPNQYLDIQLAINYVTTFSEIFQILPEYAMLGSSAGAHLAMMYNYAYDAANEVKFIANIAGPSNLEDPFYTNLPDYETQLEQLVDESQYPENANYAQLNSPVFWTNHFSSPTLMFYGKQDPLVPISNGMDLRDALNEENQSNIFSAYDGGHGNNWTEEEREDMYSKIDNYIHSYLAVN